MRLGLAGFSWLLAAAIGWGADAAREPAGGTSGVQPVVTADAPAAGATGVTTEVVRTYERFWELAQSPTPGDVPLQARLFVACYFADWGTLWVEWDGALHYIKASEQRLPLKAGTWYDVKGFLVAGTQTLAWDKTRFTPVTGLPPPPTHHLSADLSNLKDDEFQVTEIEGVVDDQTDLDNRHQRLNVVFGATHATVYVSLEGNEDISQYAGYLVKATGVLSVKRATSTSEPALELWCQSPADLRPVASLAGDPRFSQPVTPIDQVLARPAGSPVHVAGTVVRQERGQSLTLRDATGQLMVLTHQVQPAAEGDPVEAIGFPAQEGVDLMLRQGLYRLRAAAPASASTGSTLRLAEQVRELGPDDATRAPPARIAGVVTWSAPGSPFLFVEDGSGGVKVLLPSSDVANPPAVGAGVTIEGMAGPGDFAPLVKAATVRSGGNLTLPHAQTMSWEQAMTGAEYGRLVEIQGYVRSLTRTGTEWRLDLTAAGGDFTAVLTAEEAPNLEGAIVRVRGVCDVVANERRQLTGIRLLVANTESIVVVEPAPSDPFATPVESIGNLMRYNPNTPLNRRVQVSGVVLLHDPGELVYIEDGSDTLTVLSRQTEPLEPGDRIDAVGIPGQQGGRILMRDAVYRRVHGGRPPAPIELMTAAVDPRFDGHLVRISGRLLSREPTPRGLRFQLQQGNSLFAARLEPAHAGLPAYDVGATLALVGVYQTELDEYRRPRGFVVNLRSPADVTIIARPSWWTAARVLWVAVALLAIVVLTASWSFVLSRKNEQLRVAERELRRANEELERRVEERTADLKQEVEQRRASEETLSEERMLLRTLIDNLPVGLYVKDLSGRFVIGNLSHARLLGAAACEDVVGRTEADFWPRELAEMRRESDVLVMSSGDALVQQEEPFVVGGVRRWHSITRVPLRDREGRVTGLIAIVQDVTGRKEADEERENLNQQLLETSRKAGMAEVATGVLHNVGNVLNSVNVSVAMTASMVSGSRGEKLSVVTDLLSRHRANLGTFFAEDPRAQRIPDYLGALLEELRAERANLLKELGGLQNNVDHIKQIVAMQQSYSKVSGVSERVPVEDIVDDALRINSQALVRHRVDVVREFRANPTIIVERHKVLQILVNLISNAKYACTDSGREDRVVRISIDHSPLGVAIEVADNGVGVRPEHLDRIFSHGFTTRKNGHGFGLHSGALAARELGGSLSVASDGPGRGAVFTLDLPLGSA